MANRPSIFLEGKSDLQTFLNEIPVEWSQLYWPAFFPLEYNPTLNYNYIIADKIPNVTANVIAYDASAPEKTRRTIEKKFGELPKLALKRILTEIEINEYNNLIGSPFVPDNKILDFIFDDTTFCYDGVQAKRDALSLEALSTFEITQTTAKNDQGVRFQTTFSYGLPDANKRVIKSATATRVWDNGTTSNYTPITDFKDIQDAAQDAGRGKPQYAIMDTTQWRQFAMADEVLYWVQPNTFNERTFVALGEVNAMLKMHDLPQIIVVDKRITDESAEHGLTQRNPWTTNYVTFLPELQIGKMFYGPNAEQTIKPAETAQAIRDGVLISKWAQTDPVKEITKGESNCFPVIPNVVNCFRLDVISTPQADGLDN